MIAYTLTLLACIAAAFLSGYLCGAEKGFQRFHSAWERMMEKTSSVTIFQQREQLKNQVEAQRDFLAVEREHIELSRQNVGRVQ